MTFTFSSPLYVVADPLGRSGERVPTLARQLCGGGATLLQLRLKWYPVREILALGRAVGAICRNYGCVFILNDRPDLALAVGADGVHLGQDDVPPHVARGVLGPRSIIGVSTHDAAQALAAVADGVDYIGFGPVFRTSTKATGYPPQGLEGLRALRATVALPIVAIGGITAERAPLALDAGADAVAMISDLIRAPDITATTAAVLRALGRSSPP